jgi:hypothetical protein
MHVRLKRGRKKKPRLVRGLLRYLVLACIIFGTAFIYVNQCNSVTTMGYEINELRRQNALLDKQHDSLEIRLNALERPDKIKKAIKERRLRLTEVEARQKVTLPKPDPIRLTDKDSSGTIGQDEVKGESRVVRK